VLYHLSHLAALFLLGISEIGFNEVFAQGGFELKLS
jgi:hypothetical protein